MKKILSLALIAIAIAPFALADANEALAQLRNGALEGAAVLVP